jgi:curved DNA-binding protein CbpA
MPTNLYTILGVSKTATTDEIKKAYHQKALLLHPDKHVNDSEEEQSRYAEEFRILSNAFQILSDESSRARYDLSSEEPYDQSSQEIVDIIKLAQSVNSLAELLMGLNLASQLDIFSILNSGINLNLTQTFIENVDFTNMLLTEDNKLPVFNTLALTSNPIARLIYAINIAQYDDFDDILFVISLYYSEEDSFINQDTFKYLMAGITSATRFKTLFTNLMWSFVKTPADTDSIIQELALSKRDIVREINNSLEDYVKSASDFACFLNYIQDEKRIRQAVINKFREFIKTQDDYDLYIRYDVSIAKRLIIKSVLDNELKPQTGLSGKFILNGQEMSLNNGRATLNYSIAGSASRDNFWNEEQSSKIKAKFEEAENTRDIKTLLEGVEELGEAMKTFQFSSPEEKSSKRGPLDGYPGGTFILNLGRQANPPLGSINVDVGGGSPGADIKDSEYENLYEDLADDLDEDLDGTRLFRA